MNKYLLNLSFDNRLKTKQKTLGSSIISKSETETKKFENNCPIEIINNINKDI